VTWIKRFALLCAVLAAVGSVSPATPALAFSKAEVQKRIAAALLHSGASSGAFVTDLTAGEPLYAARADLARVPASNEKLYTTATALGRFGPSARLSTELLTSGTIDANGLLSGEISLKGQPVPCAPSHSPRLAAAIAEALVVALCCGEFPLRLPAAALSSRASLLPIEA
jgi:D-alanyl-D-alanine carboxypeptidase/D-alanyl-D-alanine-endopeptidase (penicillin-binding protein 4)